MTPLSASDEWRTPDWLVGQLNYVFGPFELDVAAAPWNHQAPAFFTKSDNALERQWRGRCWMNPPYSRGNLASFIPYARQQVLRGRAQLVAGVVPHSTADKWWADVARPEGRVLRTETHWARLPWPFEDWRIMRSERLTVHVIPIMKRVAFLHRTSGRSQVVGWRSNARGSHVAFCFERTSRPGVVATKLHLRSYPQKRVYT